MFEKSASCSNCIVDSSDVGSVSSFSHGKGSVVENVVTFSVGPLQSYPMSAAALVIVVKRTVVVIMLLDRSLWSDWWFWHGGVVLYAILISGGGEWRACCRHMGAVALVFDFARLSLFACTIRGLRLYIIFTLLLSKISITRCGPVYSAENLPFFGSHNRYT